jgi:hypothetical protein
MAVAEGIAYDKGLWTVCNVVTSIGFGEGPTSTFGRLVTVGAFVAAATCWFGIVSVAMAVGLSPFERNALVREALRPLARREQSKLFPDN